MATVEDNGVGLDERNWDGFTTTDTDNKLSVGGKGVGRALSRVLVVDPLTAATWDRVAAGLDVPR